VSPAPDLTFEKWRTRLQLCTSTQQLLLTVAAYLAAWRPVDMNRLPADLTSPIDSAAKLHHRAMDVTVAEVSFSGSNADWALLRELALVITAAAQRARYLESLNVH
jgi:hypothetical protein